MAWAWAAALLAGWFARRSRGLPAGLATSRPAGEGCAVLCLPGSEAADLDNQVANCDTAEVVVTHEPRLPDPGTVATMRKQLQQPGVWLACARGTFKHVLGEGWAPHRPNENGTFCLSARSNLFAFRRDVFLDMGGLARFEEQLPGQGWAALSLRAWLRGHKTVYAGGIDFRGIKPDSLPVHAAEGPPLARLLAVCDEPFALMRLLHRHARSPEFRRSYRQAARNLTLPAGKGRRGGRLMPLAEPGAVILQGREQGRSLRLAVLASELPFPASGDGARVHNLLRRLAAQCDLFLFCYAEKASKSELEALLEYCARLVVIQPPASRPVLWKRTPAGVERFQSPAMRRHLEVLLSDWQVPLVEVEGTQLAMVGSWLKRAPVAKILAAPELRFVLDKQARESSLTGSAPTSRRAAGMWRRYELRHLHRFDCILTASAADGDLLRKRFSRTLLRTVENGIDLDHFRSEGPDAGQDQVLLIAAFDEPVNLGAFQVVIQEIWPRVRDSRPRAQLTVVAGDGFRQHWRRSFRRSLPEMPPEVTVLGHVGDLRFLYERADVVLVPAPAASASARVLEALAMSRAVVAAETACGGLAVESGRDLMIAGEPAEFAAAVLTLLSDQERRRRLGAQARATVEARYDCSRGVEQRLEIYEEVLRKKK
jgi:glycosyltransferase involved in cell wall biosynthesis